MITLVEKKAKDRSLLETGDRFHFVDNIVIYTKSNSTNYNTVSHWKINIEVKI